MKHSGHHFIAVFGGAVSGAEAAYQLANRGFRVVVFDQNILPYGKIEDGLPKWHSKLRDKEEQRINEKIDLPNVRFVPGVKLGKDIDFEDIARNWGFTAVILATGAWRDRPLPINGIDQYVNRGLYYQNPFVYWFNHNHEPEFAGEKFDIVDGAAVVGGGLASLDVVKILMIESVQKALAERGHRVDMFTLDRSIAKVLDNLNLSLSDLDLEGCTLYYRRRDIDMPLSSIPTDTPEQLEKAQMVRKKILDNYQKKYLFKFEPCHMPVDKIVEGERLEGIVFRKTKIENNKVEPILGSDVEIRAPLFISSIGSIPEPIPGIPTQGQVFKISNAECCQIEGYDNVFAVGNAVTGRGNINESLKHGREITEEVMDNFLQWQEEDYQSWLRTTESTVESNINAIVDTIKRKKFMPDEVIQNILDKTEVLQKKVGYNGSYSDWVDKNLPVRLETMLENESNTGN
ncbi:FAD-dependent oxidoreductase [Fulvivirgaceae bacterium BMA10]|uniref:FAD-dependent oxidoreductase n=1 Tax=Splendidivirga corallicola TaxID=3051826 RepID=A0ABT8KI87_9BACT|nr:FAD-dependent oxidoreductase [Fulvivirgaceae bacterium BMA10]